MVLLKVLILFWVPLLLLLVLLPKNAAATSSSLVDPSPSSCEAVNDDDAGGEPNWEQIEAKVEQAVTGVTREVASSNISNHQIY